MSATGSATYFRTFGLPVVLCISLYVVNFDVGAANLAVPAVQADFRVTLPVVVWFVDGYILTLACSVLPSGLICDRLGAKRALVIGLIGFAFASLICGIAWTPTWLVAARLVQGCTSGMTIPAAFATVASTCPDQRVRARMISFMAIAAGVGVASSPPLAGWLISAFGWRVIFLVNVPLTLTTVAVLFGINIPSETVRDLHIPLRSIGSLTISLAGIAYLLIEWPKVIIGDKSLLLTGIFTVAALVLFVHCERTGPVRLIPASVCFDIRVVSLCWIGALSQGGAFAIMFLSSLLMTRWEELPPKLVGLLFVGLTGPVLVASIGLTFVMHQMETRTVVVVGLVLYVLGLTGLAASPTAVIFSFPILGVAMAFLTPPVSLGVLRSVEPSVTGTAAGLLNAARQLGALIGIAASGATILVAIKYRLGNAIPYGVLMHAAVGDLAGLAPGPAEEAREGFILAIRVVLLTIATMMIVTSFVVSQTLKPRAVSRV